MSVYHYSSFIQPIHLYIFLRKHTNRFSQKPLQNQKNRAEVKVWIFKITSFSWMNAFWL